MENDNDCDFPLCLRCGHDMSDLDDMRDNSCGCDCHEKLFEQIVDEGEVNLILPNGAIIHADVFEVEDGGIK